MKKSLFISFCVLVFGLGAMAQAPQKISYQAVVRNGNSLVQNTKVGLYLQIAKDSFFTNVVYSEIQYPVTNAYGLASIAIGNGNVIIGSLSNIKWDNSNYYIKTLIDPNGGTVYTITGWSQLLSVPYALYASNGLPSGNSPGDLLYWNGTKWVTVPAGANGSTLTLCNGVPTWGGCGGVVIGSPTVSTINVSGVSATSATFYGEVTSDGGAAVTSRGFCYSTSPNPTVSNGTVTVGSGTGTFNSTISILSASTTYYVRAFAVNSNGTSYGTQISFNTSAPAATYTLGQSFGGGLIFYIDSSKQHGLIAANNDQSGGAVWWNGSYLTTNATGTGVGTGLNNTLNILSIQSTGSYAAYYCSQPMNGYSDWFMPSRDELQLMYTNLHAKGLGGFTGAFYYSSSEYDVYQAYTLDFKYNSMFPYYKNNSARVRAVRKF